MSSNRNPFTTSARALGLYERLKEDVEAEADGILHSLPQFMRIALVEGQAGWYTEVNRYDLLVPFLVHRDFPELIPIDAKVEGCTTIKPLQNSMKFTTEHEFKFSTLVKLSGATFSLQDFVLAIAYHGTLHWEPDRPDLKMLYEDFIQRYPDIAFRMAVEVGACLVRSFEQVYEKFTGENNAYTSVYDRQPKLILNSGAKPAMLFSDSYVQLPIRAQERHGIRICLYIELRNDLSHGSVFSYGHRQKENIILSCDHTPTILLVKTSNRRCSEQDQVVRLPVTGHMLEKAFKLEVALYVQGQLVVGVNERLAGSCVLPGEFSIYDGKLMIGSDLDGQKPGSFLNSAITVEAIDEDHRVGAVFRGGLMRIDPFPLPSLPPNAVNRPAIVY